MFAILHYLPRRNPNKDRLIFSPTHLKWHTWCWLFKCYTKEEELLYCAHMVSLATVRQNPLSHFMIKPTSILPVSGWKPLAGSSVVTLHWMAQPFTLILSCLSPSSGRLRPSHTCSWAWTRSTLLEREVMRWINWLNPWTWCEQPLISFDVPVENSFSAYFKV